MPTALILLSFVISACARPSIAGSPLPARPHAERAAVVEPAAVAEPAAIVDAAEPDQSIDESRLEQAAFDGPNGIKIAISWWTLTGTTHIAAQLSIVTPRGALRFAETEAEEGGETIPIMERVLPAGANRWVVFGWSSYGSGMQTEHAWLIDDRAGVPRVADTIAWTTDRSHAGLAIDASAGVRIGIPLPDRARKDPDDSDLHDEGGWLLEHGKQTFTIDKVEKLPTTESHVMALRDFYTPPFQASPSGRQWAGRFVWFSADKRFALQR